MTRYTKNSPPSDVAGREFDTDHRPPRSDDEIDHDVYVAALIHAFNPIDDDAAQVSILLDAVDAAFAFIVAQPCTCTEPDDLGDVECCRRCDVLGRSRDEPIDR